MKAVKTRKVRDLKRRERVETRIRRDIRGFVGYDYILRLVDLCERPDVVLGLFLTGARATELLDMTRGHISNMGAYYEVRSMPVYKKYDVIGKITDEEGKVHWETELKMETRTFPILKSNPLAKPFWDTVKDREGKLFEFKQPYTKRVWRDQYWQLYKTIAEIEPPEHPLAPKYHKGEKTGKQKNFYPHWFRGQRAVQMRVEYGLTADDLMSFFRWENPSMALYYAGISSEELATKMIRGRKRIREVMQAD